MKLPSFTSILIAYCCLLSDAFAADDANDVDLSHPSLRGLNGSSDKVIAIISLNDDKTTGPANRCAKLSQASGGETKHVYSKVMSGCAISLPRAAMSGLANNPSVKFIEEDQEVYASAVTSWGLDRIDQCNLSLNGQATKVDASDVKVYIIDTGINGGHQEFDGMLDDTNCHSDKTNEGNALNDGNGHGTHVAGTTCGKTYGVASGCTLCAVKVLSSSGSGTNSGVIAGIEHAAADCNGGKCVANMSLGGGASSALDAAVAEAVRLGVTMVVAAGNENTNACNGSPAREPSAITVGSTTRTDERSSFSNYGSCVDVYAPGSSITSAWKGSSTATNTISGTSMASPHVAGLVAGIKGANPSWNPTQVQAELEANTKVIGTGPSCLDMKLTVTKSGCIRSDLDCSSFRSRDTCNCLCEWNGNPVRGSCVLSGGGGGGGGGGTCSRSECDACTGKNSCRGAGCSWNNRDKSCS